MNNYWSQIDKISEDFFKTFGHLSAEQLNWKPNANTWSIAQNINHLIVVGETYYSTFAALKAHTYKPPLIAKLKIFVSFFEKVILDAVQPDRRKKMKTFPIWEPTVSELPADILEQFRAFQATLKSHIEDLTDLAAQGAVISSPANKNIVYRLEIAFEIIITHEKRHFEQAKEVLSALK